MKAPSDDGVTRAVTEAQAFNLAALLDRAVDHHPEREALTSGERRLSYRDLRQRVHGVARMLIDWGLAPGDRAAVLLPNCVEFVELFYGVLWAGAVLVPINLRLAAPEIVHIVEHSDARMLFAAPNRARQLAECGGAGRAQLVAVPGENYSAASADVRPLACAPAHSDDLQRIMYTSGTTGRPKGVMIHHGAVLWKCLNQVVEFGLGPEEVFLASGPLYHVGTLDLPGLGVHQLGGRVVLMPRFDERVLLETVARERITCTFLAPSMINRLLAMDDLMRYDLSSLRVIIDGSEKMPLSLLKRMPTAFPNAAFYDGFGMTETVTGDCFLAPRRGCQKPGSLGRATLAMELAVVDEHDRPVEPRIPGELVIRGPKLCLGYWRDPEATRRAFRSGWFHTGDVAIIDDDGDIFVVDRIKDMIKPGGENVASVEVERVLYAHPGVLEAAVVGRSDERWGEVPVAFVVARPGARISVDEVIAHCRTQLAGFKVPKAIEFVDELPRTPSGKVRKGQLRGMAGQTARAGEAAS